jgi:hypothetical protein
MSWGQYVGYGVTAIMTVLGAFILMYLRELKDKARSGEEKAKEVEQKMQAELRDVRQDAHEFREKVAEKYVTRDDFVRIVSGLDERLETGFKTLSSQVGDVRQAVAAIEARTEAR